MSPGALVADFLSEIVQWKGVVPVPCIQVWIADRFKDLMRKSIRSRAGQIRGRTEASGHRLERLNREKDPVVRRSEIYP